MKPKELPCAHLISVFNNLASPGRSCFLRESLFIYLCMTSNGYVNAQTRVLTSLIGITALLAIYKTPARTEQGVVTRHHATQQSDFHKSVQHKDETQYSHWTYQQLSFCLRSYLG